MIACIWTAATGMAAQQQNMDVIANNLANSSTTGFKASRANFEDLMYQNIVSPGAQTSNGNNVVAGIQFGMGAKTASVQKVYTEGNLNETDNPLDLAIQGDGFFKVLEGTQEVYTRAGTFSLDKDGYLCDAQGNRLQPEISIPQGTVTINIDSGGTLTALDQNGKVLSTQNISLFSFANPAGLLSLGKNYAIPTAASGQAQEGQPGMDGFGTLLQGYLENSNINVVQEMVNMIVGQRAYEANSKVIKAADQMLQTANNLQT